MPSVVNGWSTAEAASFEAETYFKEAVRIREWADRGKVAGSAPPDLVSYRPLIEHSLCSR